MDVSIIIVNYNTLELSNNCIESIIKNTKGIEYEIILVDNDSKDGSQLFFRDDVRITYIESKDNIGFGRANNLGVERASGKYLFFLNSDTVLTANSIKKLYDFAEANQSLKIGELGVLLLDKQGAFNKPFSSLPSTNYIRLFIDRYFKRINYVSLIEKIKNCSFSEVGFVCGADIFTPRTVIDDIGGAFDPDFFMFAEEIDMAKRMQIKGYKRIVINDTGIIHYGSGSFDMDSMVFSRYKMMTTSALLYHKKHDNRFFHFFSLIDRTRIVFRDMRKSNFTKRQKSEIYHLIWN